VAANDPAAKADAPFPDAFTSRSYNTVLGEEELTTKEFKLAGSGLFIVASVFYTDESTASAKGRDCVSLELALSKGKERDVLRSLNWAAVEMPVSTFDVGRVSILIKVNGRTELVVMECRKDTG
jgi:hypothetical protein